MTLPDPDDRLTLDQAAALAGASVKSVRRWIRDGVTAGGRRVRLASLKVGGARVTSRSWLAEFVRLQNPAGVPMPTPAERRRDVERARAELTRILGG